MAFVAATMEDAYATMNHAEYRAQAGLPVIAATIQSVYVTDSVHREPWFAGKLDRTEAEQRLKDGNRAGNFLVRQKDDGKTFVHSYLSLTRMKIVHNMIEFGEDGAGGCTVDNVKWPHQAKPTLEEVVDKMCEIRRKRNGITEGTTPDPAIAAALEAVWPRVYREVETKGTLADMVKGMTPGSFLLCPIVGERGHVVMIKKRKGCAPVMCPHSIQGHYLKYSELIGKTIKDLIVLMIQNSRGTALAPSGIALPLHVPTAQELDAVQEQKSPSLPPPRRGSAPAAGADDAAHYLPPGANTAGDGEDDYYTAEDAVTYGDGESATF